MLYITSKRHKLFPCMNNKIVELKIPKIHKREIIKNKLNYEPNSGALRKAPVNLNHNFF